MRVRSGVAWGGSRPAADEIGCSPPTWDGPLGELSTSNHLVGSSESSKWKRTSSFWVRLGSVIMVMTRGDVLETRAEMKPRSCGGTDSSGRRERGESEGKRAHKSKDGATNTLKSTIPSRTGLEPDLEGRPRGEISYQPTAKSHRAGCLRPTKIYVITLEYRQSAVMETAAATKNNKKIYSRHPQRWLWWEGRRRGDGSVFGLCGLSLFFLLVPVSSPHLESGREEIDHRSARVGRCQEEGTD